MKITTQLNTDWTFRETGTDDWHPAKVPGCIHTDLHRNGLIPDPFYRNNETALQSLDRKNWEYRLVFDVHEQTMIKKRHTLVFDGLDTYAEVFLNGQEILSTSNMFMGYEADVSSILKESTNQLLIRFRSPVTEDLPKAQNDPIKYPANNDVSEMGGLGETKISIFARKAPYHYGWDWGPRFITCGIWKPIRLDSWDGPRITDVFIEQQTINTDQAQLCAKINVDANAACTIKVEIAWEGKIACVSAEIHKGCSTLEIPFTIEQPRLWWCRGQGPQELYDFICSVSITNGKDNCDQKTITTGLRTARLVTQKDEWGTSFYIELNGRPVFMKGGNHIPNDNFPAEVTWERYEEEIKSCADANFNSIRVWGGGYYENDNFYALCDKYGILIWQDFMFACSMYPSDDAFLKSIKEEAIYNIRRLRNHPCIALWCGNNEIDSAWQYYKVIGGWGWKNKFTSVQRKILWTGYQKIFHKILPLALSVEYPQASYWPSSPQANLKADASSHSRYDTTEGDMHYWGVWHGKEPFHYYHKRIGRFMSEYGFQSFPEMKVLESFGTKDDMNIDSSVMKAHQKSAIGNHAILDYMKRDFHLPKDFSSFVYLSQLLQAEAIRSAVEAHRLRRGFCMGSLYWQINDCWPAPSWASIDYYGNWKAQHYFMRESMADVALSVRLTEGKVSVCILNDLPENKNLTMTALAYDFQGNKLSSLEICKTVTAMTSLEIQQLTPKNFFGIDVKKTVLVVSLYENKNLINQRTAFFSLSKELDLPVPSFDISTSKITTGWELKLTAKTFIKNLAFFSNTDGRFSDNYFDLIPGQPKTIIFDSSKSDQPIFTWKSVAQTY